MWPAPVVLGPLGLLLALGWSSSSGAAGAALQKQVAEISEDGANEVWWRAEWARILELSGSWAVRTEQDFTFLRPEDSSCLLRLLARSTGEVFDYPMQPEGQVALAFDWIMISTEDPLACADRLGERRAALPVTSLHPSILPSTINVREVERVVVRGSNDLFFEVDDDSFHRLKMWRHSRPDEPENQVLVKGVSGAVWTIPRREGAVLTRIRFSGRASTPYSDGYLLVGDRLPAE